MNLSTATNDGWRRVHPAVWIIPAVLAAGLAIAVVYFDVVAWRRPAFAPRDAGITAAVPGLALAWTGCAIAARRGRHPIAAVMVVAGLLCMLVGLANGWLNYGAFEGIDLPLLTTAALANHYFPSAAITAVPIIVVLFPNGKVPLSRVGRIAAISAIACAAFPVALKVLMPWDAWIEQSGQDPGVYGILMFDVGSSLPLDWALLHSLYFPSLLLCLALVLVALFERWRTADPATRHRLRWVLWAGWTFVLAILVAIGLQHYLAFHYSVMVGTVALCAAVFAAVTGHRTGDVDRLLTWTFVYTVLIGAVIAVDVAFVALWGQVIDDDRLMMLAVVVVLVAYAPARERLLSAAWRLVNGRRDDPYGVLSDLARSLEQARTPQSQLDHLARAVASAFASPAVDVNVMLRSGHTVSASYGTSTGSAHHLDLTFQGMTIGTMSVAPGRARDLSAHDQQLLSNLINLTASALYLTDSHQQLADARRAIVTAREDERQRLRRDLHDGIGPTLAAASLRLEAAANSVESDPAKARALITDVVADLGSAVDGVRRLVQGLRPPSLDDVGLAHALSTVARSFCTDSLTVSADVDLPPAVPPAVEVAVYRIVSEALTNVARHASASAAVISVNYHDGHIQVVVSDDGTGTDALVHTGDRGLGLTSMRDRAEEIGGTFEFTSSSSGSQVVARLPVEIGAP